MGSRTIAGAFVAYWRRCDARGRKPDWIAVAIFFVVACAWSFFAARWGELRLITSLPMIDAHVLVGFGPMLGALVAGGLRGDRGNWPIGFRGLAPNWSMLALVVPIVAMAIVGVKRFHVEPHLDGAVIATTLMLAAIGGEIGWREWLHNMLAGFPLWIVALICWALWLVWAFSIAGWPVEGIDPLMPVLLLVASFALAAIARETHSSAFAAAWHGTFLVAIPAGLLVVVLLVLAALTWKAAIIVRRLTL